MAAYYLRSDLVLRVAGILGVIQVGQPLEAEDQALIDAQIDPCCAALAAKEVIYLTSTMPTWKIPAAIFEQLAACVAACVPDYGLPIDSSTAEAEIRFMQRKGPSYEPVRADYF